MIETTHRPFSVEERSAIETELLQQAQGPRWIDRVMVHLTATLLGAALGMGLGIVAMQFLPPDLPACSAVLACAILGAITGIWRATRAQEYRNRERWEQILCLARLLERGEVEITRVVACSVVEIPEDEDEGPAFFLDIGNEQALFVRGTYAWELYAEVETDTTALYSAFDLVRYPDESTYVVRVEPHDAPLLPTRLIHWRSYEASTNFADGEILNGISLATLERDFPDLFASEPENM